MLKKIDYLPHLEACWQEHLEPRAEDAPTVISTFAGGGGSSLGYSMAGFRELLAVEWDNNAVETFKLNFPDVPVYHGDIAKLSVEEVLERTGLEPGELDIFDGSPPCQGFSTAGKRQLDDSRNELYLEFSRLLRGLQPKVFVMENVSGMVKGKMKIVFAEILRDLKSCGYKVSARLLNAMYFGVPQSRQRMIFIGVREDLGIEPSHPKAETRAVNVRNAFKKCSPNNYKKLSRKAREIYRATPRGASLEVGALSIGRSGYYTHQRLCFEKVCGVVQKSIGSLIYHPTEERSVSIEELKRLGSFPDAYKFTDLSNGWARIGNSVPPLFMRSIALHIRKEILNG